MTRQYTIDINMNIPHIVVIAVFLWILMSNCPNRTDY